MGSKMQENGINSYNAQCIIKEREFAIMLNNPQFCMVTIENGHTLEEIEKKQQPELSVIDNIACVNP